MKAENRITFLDGLRGVAILLVVIWHAYGPTYSNILPFGDQYAVMPIRVFWVGVELFFLISGFVIAMTLEKCASLSEFALRRWSRLFPAMLVTSILILCFDLSIGIGPHAARGIVNLVPGLLFISPAIIHAVTGLTIESMDGTFWSLYVEVNFYIVFGVFYYYSGLRVAITSLFLLSLVACGAGFVAELGIAGHLFGRVAAMLDWLGFVHFGWFASGALFYQYFTMRRLNPLILAVATGTVAALDWKPLFFSLADRLALLSMVGIFSVAVTTGTVQRILSTRLLTLAGFISYPLYLLHDNIVVGLTQLMGRTVPLVPFGLDPIGPIISVMLVAFVIAKVVEPRLRTLMVSRVAVPLGAFFKDRSERT
jgi:peptidoglycan/LPS O-acetylase OafA/YrhL